MLFYIYFNYCVISYVVSSPTCFILRFTDIVIVQFVFSLYVLVILSIYCLMCSLQLFHISVHVYWGANRIYDDEC